MQGWDIMSVRILLWIAGVVLLAVVFTVKALLEYNKAEPEDTPMQRFIARWKNWKQ